MIVTYSYGRPTAKVIHDSDAQHWIADVSVAWSAPVPSSGYEHFFISGANAILSPTAPNDARQKKQRILYWLTEHPGSNARHVAEALHIQDLEALVLVQEMLREGVLDFDA
jgi:hypothetical protein